MEALLATLAGLKQATPSLLISVAATCGLILFLDDSLLTSLGLLEIRNEHRTALGGVALICGVLFVAAIIPKIGSIITDLYNWIKRKINQTAKLKNLHKSLNQLTPNEQAYLAPYILEQQTTQYFLIEDGIAAELQIKTILFKPVSSGNLIRGIAFNLQPWARNYLNDHPETLEGRTQNIQRLSNSIY